MVSIEPAVKLGSIKHNDRQRLFQLLLGKRLYADRQRFANALRNADCHVNSIVLDFVHEREVASLLVRERRNTGDAIVNMVCSIGKATANTFCLDAAQLFEPSIVLIDERLGALPVMCASLGKLQCASA